MDEETQSNAQPANQPAGGQPIDVTVNANPSPPASPAEAAPAPAPTPVPSQPATAAEPEPIMPPAPGTVVTSGSESAVAPSAGAGLPPQQVVTSAPGGGKRWLKRLIALILLVVVIAGGWFVYQHFYKKAPAAKPTSVNASIPLLKIGVLQADYGNVYPDMSASSYGYLVNAQMFDGLVRYEDKSKLVPDLASNWTNPDNSTWLFTIKKNIKFHDGNTLTASDVKYSLDTITASNSDFAQTFAGSIASVDVVSTNQVKITTKSPDPTLLNRLAFLYIIDAKLPKGDESSLAGTGPYQIKPGTTPTSSSYQMVAAANYSGSKPSVKALNFGSEDDAGKLVKAFEAHQFNIAGPVPPSDAKKVPGATQFISSEPDVDFLGFNTVKPGPLQNKLVREAIRYAVNPTAIGQARGTKVTPISQLIPQSIPGYNPSITPYKQDIAKAKQLLAQAGYPNGLTLRYSSSADVPATTAEITKELQAVGITLTPDVHSDFDEYINYFTNGQAELYSVDYSSDTLDGLDIYQTTLSPNNYNNPQLTALLNQVSTTTDPAKRLKILQNAATIINQDVAVVPTGTGDNIWLMDKPYAIQQDMPSSFISVYFSKVHLR